MAGATEVMTLLVQHISSQSAVQALIGIRPCKVFPGDVPLRVDSREITPPWVNLRQNDWDEFVHFRGGTGTFHCPTTIAATAATVTIARELFDAVRESMANKWSETWADRLFVQEATMTLGRQVDVVNVDGSPSNWQQIEGELNLICCVNPA